MKLHLPKLLRVALLSAVFSYAAAYAETENIVYPIVKEDVAGVTGVTHIDVGFAVVDGNFDNRIVTYKPSDGLLVIDSDDKVGAFTSSGLHTVFANGMGNSTNVTNALQINGDLIIKGSGQVMLGGQSHKNIYTGLLANNVTIDSTATGNASSPDGGNSHPGANLNATRVHLNTLTVNGGYVFIHKDQYNGNNFIGIGDGNSINGAQKMSVITQKITVSGTGYLEMGRYKAGNTQFTTGLGTGHYHAERYKPAILEQTGGTLKIVGRVLATGGLKIEQSKGIMEIAKDGVIKFDNGSYLNTIRQYGDDSEKSLTIGEMTGGTANSPVVVNIIQEGLGSINLINGATFKAGTGKESSITQSGGGTVNLTGDFSKAVFNVDLTDGTLALTTSGTKLMGYTMTLASGVQLDNNGKLTIGTGTEGDAGVLNVTSGGTLNVMLDGTDAAINVGAAAKDTNTVTGWTMASGSTFGIGLKKDYFEKVNVTNNTITINALVADVASGSSVDTNAFECEYTIGEIEGFASEQWKLEDGAGLIIE